MLRAIEDLKEAESKSWYQRIGITYKVYQEDKVAIDTKIRKSDVNLGDKCCDISGKDVVLTWEVLSLRGERKSAAAIVPNKDD